MAVVLTEAGSKPACELLLERLVTGPDEQSFRLVKLCGDEVPVDLELYFCRRTFVSIQVRAKARAPAGGPAHEYSLAPEDVETGGKGGVYDLRCQRSSHHLQVKVQPALGLRGLLPPEELESSGGKAARGKIFALLGLHNLLVAFHRDATREAAQLSPTVGKYVEVLATDPALMQRFLEKCPPFSSVASEGPPKMRLADPTKAKSRGILLKALVEVKMLLMEAMQHCLSCKDRLQQSDVEAIEEEVLQNCCRGGAQGQYKDEEESMEELQLLVCGTHRNPARGKAKEEALKLLRDCVANCRAAILPKLRTLNKASDLHLPSLDLRGSAAGAEFKEQYNRIWKVAVESYVFDLTVTGAYQQGVESGLKMLRDMWSKPDEALKLLCPSDDLDKAIVEWEREFEKLLTDLSAKAGRALLSSVSNDAVSSEKNFEGLAGLQNLGENLCAANALVQLLFSVAPFRTAVAASTDPSRQQSTGSNEEVKSPTEEAARQVVAGARRAFAEMANPGASTASAGDVAAGLYGAELGQQQDCDELMHRLSLLLHDGLGNLKGDPYCNVWQAFQRSFLGSTYEVQVRHRDAATPYGDVEEKSAEFQPLVGASSGCLVIGHPCRADASKKPFLSIPIQRGNLTIAQALEEFTSWVFTGGKDVMWTREQFRTLPCFLCFASRQVSVLDWEESLDLSNFIIQSGPEMQRENFERSRARQIESEYSGALELLTPAGDNLLRASTLDREAFSSEASILSTMMKQLKEKVDQARERLAKLDAEASNELPQLEGDLALAEFLRDAVGQNIIEDVFHSLLGVDSVEKLSELVLDESGASSDILDQLVHGGSISEDEAHAVIARLHGRWRKRNVAMYVVHAVVVYQGAGLFGHYIIFVRQEDGTFMCFDDARVTAHEDAGAVKAEIVERGSDGFPASVRLLVYRRKAFVGEALEPLEVAGAPAEIGRASNPVPPTAAAVGVQANGCKRRRLRLGLN